MNKIKNISNENGSIPFVLSIAGFDPSGGAGLVADIKTFHSQDTYGLGIISCNTIQTDEQLFQVDWQNEQNILSALEKLCARYPIAVIKLGAMRDPVMLERIIDQIYQELPEASIVWDPVLKATKGGRFFALQDEDLAGKHKADWKRIVQKCRVITPNAQEAVVLCQLLGLSDSQTGLKPAISSLDPALRKMAGYTAVLLKGGHLSERPALDRLYEKDSRDDDDDGDGDRMIVRDSTGSPVGGEPYVFGRQSVGSQQAVMTAGFEKHGSGCVHSSLVAAMLAKGYPLHRAAEKAKEYMDEFLFTCPGKLGVHGWVRTGIGVPGI